MPAAGPVLLHRDDRGVATLSIANAAKANRLGAETMRAFVAAVARLADDPALRVLVVTGEGERAFMGGANLFELGALDRDTARAFITEVHLMGKVLRDLPVPVIARVNGWALGAGLEVMAACDMRVAADHAQFGMPEVKVGLPSVVEAALLPQLIGWGRTKVLLYTAENIDAATAFQWGLVEKVVPAAELDAAVSQWVDAILEAGPNAIRLQKELIREWEAMGVNDGIQAGIRSLVRAYETNEPTRLIDAALTRLRERRG